MSYTDFDVVVVGASLAGAMSALELGRAGHRVALIDKATFPRKKACGEGLSTFAVGLLNSAGVSILPRPVNGYRIWKDSRCQSLGTDQMAVGIRRLELDHALVSAALKFDSITPMFGEKIRRVEFTRSNVSVTSDKGTLTARSIILADGGHSVTARRLGVPERVGKLMRYGASLSCRVSAPLRSVEILLRPEFESYVTPIDDTHVNIAFVGTERANAALLRPKYFLAEIAELSKTLQREFSEFEPTIGVGAVAPRTRPAVFGPALLAGDACESLDPVSGMGMTHALLSGQNAGQILGSALSGEYSLDEAATRYQAAQRRTATKFRGYSRLSHLLITRLRKLEVINLTNRLGAIEHIHSAMFREQGSPLSRVLSTFGAPL